MAATWTVDAFVTNLKDALEADASWQALDPGVVVFDYFPSTKEQTSDWVALGFDADDNPDKVIFDGPTHSRDEFANVDCVLVVRRDGSGPAVAKEARTRAVTAIGHIDRILRNTAAMLPGTFVVRPKITSRDMGQWPAVDPVCRVSSIQFTISYQARTTP